MLTHRRKMHPFQEPLWPAAPAWAQFWAVNRDGFAFWYAVEPRCGCMGWWNRVGTQRRAVLPRWFLNRLNMKGINWRETLRQRPASEQTSAEALPTQLPTVERDR